MYCFTRSIEQYEQILYLQEQCDWGGKHNTVSSNMMLMPRKYIF